MTSGAVLVEAARRSGSMHMMRCVLDLRRPAMVVPGPVTSALSAGCHELLRAHPEATLVTETAHILEALDRVETTPTTTTPDELDEL
jgi:DNA processing protein